MGFWQDITGQTAASKAAQAQTDAANLGIEEQRRQFDAMQANMNPYMDAGKQALASQMDLSGANGPEAQAAARAAINSSEGFQYNVDQGEKGILQNASATGGVRGGNTQGVLAQYRPAMLNQAVDQQYAQYGGLSGMGLSAASGVSQAGMGMAGNISDQYSNIGQIQAQNEMAQYSMPRNMLGDLAGFGLNIAGLF